MDLIVLNCRSKTNMFRVATGSLDSQNKLDAHLEAYKSRCLNPPQIRCLICWHCEKKSRKPLHYVLWPHRLSWIGIFQRLYKNVSSCKGKNKFGPPTEVSALSQSESTAQAASARRNLGDFHKNLFGWVKTNHRTLGASTKPCPTCWGHTLRNKTQSRVKQNWKELDWKNAMCHVSSSATCQAWFQNWSSHQASVTKVGAMCPSLSFHSTPKSKLEGPSHTTWSVDPIFQWLQFFNSSSSSSSTSRSRSGSMTKTSTTATATTAAAAATATTMTMTAKCHTSTGMTASKNRRCIYICIYIYIQNMV